MAIIDRNCIFFEGPVTAQTTGNVVALTSLTLPGRMEPMPLRISVTEAFDPAETASLALTLEEAALPDGGDSAWTAVAGASWTLPAEALTLGARLGPRFLPQGVREPYLRLKLTPTAKDGKGIARGRIFAALMREDDLPWVPALQKK